MCIIYKIYIYLVWKGVGLQEAAEDVPQPVLHKGQVDYVAAQHPQVEAQAGDVRKGKLRIGSEIL